MALIDTILQKGHFSSQNTTSQKKHPKWMAPHKNGISQKRHLTEMASQNLHYWFSEVLPTPC